MRAYLLTYRKVAVYYLGTLVGCLFGGSYGDKNGRIKTIKFGALCAIIGAIFQTSAQGPTWMILGNINPPVKQS